MNEPRQLNRQRVLSNYEFNPQSICDFNVTKTRDSTTELEPFLSRCGEYDKKKKKKGWGSKGIELLNISFPSIMHIGYIANIKIGCGKQEMVLPYLIREGPIRLD